MPNWCSCDLVITGKREWIEQLLKERTMQKDGITTLDFQKIIPMPPEIEATHEYYGPENMGTRKQMYGMAGPDGKDRPLTDEEIARRKEQYGVIWWYDWTCKYWGTKWDACHVKTEPQWLADNRLQINFDTAWSPPVPVIVALSSQYPALSFVLDGYEMGMQYHSHLWCKNGEIKTNKTEPYHGQRGG